MDGNMVSSLKHTIDKHNGKLFINDKDFIAAFTDGCWVVKWKWEKEAPKQLQTRIAEYGCVNKSHIRASYDETIMKWINNKWLVPYDEKDCVGILPMLAVFQHTKNKVRPVFDFRQLNDSILNHTGSDNTVVCNYKLRKWRTVGDDLTVVDLQDAYLQIYVDPSCHKYQCIRYKEQTYALTRLGFGLCSAPKVMQMIVKKVLSQDNTIANCCDAYIDDIVVQHNKVCLLYTSPSPRDA